MAVNSGGIASVAVLGVGTMGQGITVATAAAGIPVRVFDLESALSPGMRAIQRRFAAASTGTASVAELVRAANTVSQAVRDADLVVEAVTENVAVKRELFAELTDLLKPTAILATNTSSLPLTDLVPAVPTPERFLATHFFNPAELVPGVEVAVNSRTEPAAHDAVVAFLTAIGKEPIDVGAGAGFVANRLQLALFLEALACVREGAATPERVDAVVRRTFGFRLPAYGPFAVADMAGLDVYASILETLENAYGARFSAPDEVRDMVASGRLGVKTRAGFRDYTEDEVTTLLAARDTRYRRLLSAAE